MSYNKQNKTKTLGNSCIHLVNLIDLIRSKIFSPGTDYSEFKFSYLLSSYGKVIKASFFIKGSFLIFCY